MTLEAILRAALEEIGKVGAVPGGGHGRCQCCSRAVIDCSVKCSGSKARAALDAAAKAEGLADDTKALAHAYEAVLDHVNNRPEAADACAKDILRAIDAYQRGEAP